MMDSLSLSVCARTGEHDRGVSPLFPFSAPSLDGKHNSSGGVVVAEVFVALSNFSKCQQYLP